MKRQTLSGYGSAVATLVVLAMFCPMTWAQYTWTQQSALGSAQWYGAAVSADGTKMVVCARGGSIFTSSDTGNNWVDRSAAAGSRNWRSVACSDDGAKLVAAVCGGYLYQSTDSGVTWTERQASYKQWVGIDCSADGTKWAAMPRNSYVYTSSNSGVNWTEQAGSGSRGWQRVAMSDDGTKLLGTVYTGSADNYVYTSTDSGVTWTERTQPGASDWNACVSSADGTILAIGATYTLSSYIWTSSDSGATWTERTSSGDRDWKDMACTPDGSTMIAASGNALLISTDSGATWSEIEDAGTYNFEAVDMSEDASVVVAVTKDGFVYVGLATGLTTPTVTTATSSSITATTATCGGEVTADGGADVTARGVCWSTSANPTVADDKTTDGTGTGEFTSGLTGLSANTTYYVAAYATNSEGTSYGDDVTFTTLEAPNLHLTITCAQETAVVGDELTFEIGLENTGDGNATDVVVTVPLTDSVEFVSAALATDGQTAQAAVVATEVNGEVVIEIGDVAADESLVVDLLVDALEAGELSLSASVTSVEITTPVEADAAATVTVETVADAISPACAAGMCGPVGLTPLLIMSGLFGMKHYRRRRGGVS